ncbi:NAD(P)H-binding protein [Pendulispora brunnea]|uniref:NAD(P)H-binding protein n=1 Tax=Pendulispora brunnea TaxID=2905690 RepID=A0ABZ2JVB3_9BACT
MKNIVVTGATGNIGSRVVLELAARNHGQHGNHGNVIAFVRDPLKASPLAAAGAVLRRGTLEDSASLQAGFAGADTVVLITAGATAAEQAKTAIDTACAVGVRKIVRVSSLKASVDGPTDPTRQDGRTENHLRECGLTHVILRGHCFMQNILKGIRSIRDEGKLYFGSGSGKIGMIDARDIADAAVVASIRETWDGGTFELTGPAAIDFETVAAAIASELGRDVGYVPISPEAAGEAARRFGTDAWTASVLTEYCAAYAKGWGDFTTPNLANMTGHAPRSITDFAREVLVPAIHTM